MTLSLPRRALTASFAKKLAAGALIAAAALSLAACETTGAGSAGPASAAAPQGPMTHQKAALYCWMKTEHGRADLPIDKRADLVDKCIKEKMQGT